MTTSELVPQTAPPQALTTSQPSKAAEAGFFNVSGFELMQRVATAFSKSSLVPKEYQNNVPNCMIALSIADRVGSDPLMVMQNLVVVHGRPTWSAQFLIATANACGRFSALRFEFFGTPGADDLGCRAWAIEKSTSEKLTGSDVTIAIAKKEGWYQKSGSKWQTIPQQMLMYRAGSWWVRAYAPELSLGLHTADEAIDIIDADKRADGSFGMATLDKAREQMSEVVDTTAEDVHSDPDPEVLFKEADEMVDSAILGILTQTSKEALDAYAVETRAKINGEPISADMAQTLIRKFNTAYYERAKIYAQKR